MSKTTQAADIDTFALNLMLDVWKIGNSHGPDSQRKAKIQCRLIDALKEFAAPIANTPAMPDVNALAEFMDKTAHNCSQSWYEFAKKICEWLATPATNGREVPVYIKVGYQYLVRDGFGRQFWHGKEYYNGSPCTDSRSIYALEIRRQQSTGAQEVNATPTANDQKGGNDHVPD